MSRRLDFIYFSEEKLESLLRPLGHSLKKPADLARTVKKLSDFYIDQPEAATPWHNRDTQAAYLSYYLPLGMLRWTAVLREARNQKFLTGLENFLDYGSGPGTAALVVGQDLGGTGTAIERSAAASAFHQRVFKEWPGTRPRKMNFVVGDRLQGEAQVLLLSYVLTELAHLPVDWERYETVIIMEPSTQSDGRRLMERREQFIAAGYRIWAPCVHQLSCPLLIHSRKDWCHDRVGWERPEWWLQMEKFLPFKNQTATFSYLMMSRRAPPALPQPQETVSCGGSAGAHLRLLSPARVIGDVLPEKGKTRQLICRSDAREFLSWLHKQGEVPEYERGDLVEVENTQALQATTTAQTKGAEVRAATRLLFKRE